MSLRDVLEQLPYAMQDGAGIMPPSLAARPSQNLK